MYTLQLDRCMCTILTRHASINQIKSHWKTSEGEKQAYICCMFVEGKSKTVFFPSDTLIYGICRDGTKNNNIRACEHLILGQFRMGARSAIYAPLPEVSIITNCNQIHPMLHWARKKWVWISSRTSCNIKLLKITSCNTRVVPIISPDLRYFM